MDTISPTPRNKLLGLLADSLRSGHDAFTYEGKNKPATLLSEAIGIPDIAKMLDNLSYGESLGTGGGLLWKPKDVTFNAALATLPFLGKAPKAAGLLSDLKFAENAAVKTAPKAMINNAPINQSSKVVYHASPHKFDAFDSSKIGVGEGSQSYGHGLYLADSPSVSGMNGEYFNQFKNHPAVKDSGGPFAYKVDLPDEHIAKMLDWDKPLSEQSSEIRNAFNDYRKNIDVKSERSKIYDSYDNGEISLKDRNQKIADLGAESINDQMRGETAYGLINSMSDNRGGGSAFLRDKGITGIRYLDSGSRGAGAGTSNYVVFPQNERLLKILERNGEPINQPFVYPQAAAHETARKNAVKMLGLPENNTAMDRAKALGFDKDVLHGTKNPNIKEFSKEKSNDSLTWVTDSPNVSNQFATDSKGYPTTMLLKAKMENPADWKAYDKLTIDEFKPRGYDSAWLPDGNESTGFVLEPNQLRSRFAAFDPARIHENDLLAGALPFTYFLGQDEQPLKTQDRLGKLLP